MSAMTHKHSCRVEGSFWMLYFTCRICGAVRAIPRDDFTAHTLLRSG
jgi:hypothetical protein